MQQQELRTNVELYLKRLSERPLPVSQQDTMQTMLPVLKELCVHLHADRMRERVIVVQHMNTLRAIIDRLLSVVDRLVAQSRR